MSGEQLVLRMGWRNESGIMQRIFLLSEAIWADRLILANTVFAVSL